MTFDRLYAFVHDGLYSVRSGAGMANMRFLVSVVRLGYGPRLVVGPVWTPAWNADYDESLYRPRRMLLETSGAQIVPVDNGSSGADRYGNVHTWRVSSQQAFRLIEDWRVPGETVLLISFDSPFLDLVPLLAEKRGLIHVHVPRGTALLHAPDDADRLAYEKQALKRLDSANTLLGAISQYMADHLVEEYGLPTQKLVPLRCGVLPDEHHRFSTSDLEHTLADVGVLGHEPFLLSFGRAEPYKGFHVLLDALSVLEEPPLLVLFAALVDPRHDYLRCLRARIESESLDVRLLTEFDLRTPRILQQAGSLLGVVVPSLVEPFGLIVAEVLTNPFCAAPLICSRVGGMAEQVEDGETGFTFRPGDSADLAAKLRTAREMNGEERQRMKTRAAATCERFDATHNAEVFLAQVADTFEEA